ncbi:MAG: hypothetical protein V1806_16760 [Pseudomonadota bacterium]
MRYFGKDGAQCRPPSLDAPTRVGRCRKLGRAVLHGRVPRSSVMLMGVAVTVIGLSLCFWSYVCVSEGGRGPLRDAAAAMSIRR